MPSEKILASKKQVVEDLAAKLKGATTAILVDYKGITVEDDTKLRRELRAEGVEYTVVKNSLMRFASEKVGYDFGDALTGTTALAVSEDVVAPARILAKFAKGSETFKIKAGFIDKKMAELSEINAIAALPPKPVLLATVLGTLNAPIAAFARVINAIAEQKGEAGEE